MHITDDNNRNEPLPSSNAESEASKCPVMSNDHPLRNSTWAASQSRTDHERIESSPLSKFNPLNYMPSLANRKEHAEQTITLPLLREKSSIPRGDAESNWEYPSPQQMYNAMLRKGYTDTPAEHVESMVAVHNFLNEGAWNEIVEWEHIFSKGLGQGWQQCKGGEEGIAMDRMRRELIQERRAAMSSSISAPSISSEEPPPKLLRFMGRPQEPSPKSRILSVLGWAFPESYSSHAPFDRHDWYVARRQPDGKQKEVRYVIDYYAGGTQETGEPVFYLDIRPALDTPTAALERTMRWGGDVWFRASGAGARQKTTQ